MPYGIDFSRPPPPPVKCARCDRRTLAPPPNAPGWVKDTWLCVYCLDAASEPRPLPTQKAPAP